MCNYRLKELKDELESMKGRVNAADRAAASMEAQRKSAVADKATFAKQVRLHCI